MQDEPGFDGRRDDHGVAPAADAPPPPSGGSPRSRTLWIAIVAFLAGSAAATVAYRALDTSESTRASKREKQRKKKKKKRREDQEARTPDDVTPAPAPDPAPVAPAPRPRRDVCAERSAPHPALVDPSRAPEVAAPATFRARFDTTAGTFFVACKRDLAPHGADRLFTLLSIRFYDGVPFYRVVEGFVTQWGIHPNPDVNSAWEPAYIDPDRVVGSNERGTLVFAQAGRPAKTGYTSERRSVQLYINRRENRILDRMGFAPLCRVEADGMRVVEKIYADYGEKAGRDQGNLNRKGGTYMKDTYPALDYIERACLVH